MDVVEFWGSPERAVGRDCSGDEDRGEKDEEGFDPGPIC